MPRWLWWTILAVISWGVWALLGKLVGEAISPALTQALSTIGTVPVLVALGFSINFRGGQLEAGSFLPSPAGGKSEKSSTGLLSKQNKIRGILFAIGAGILTSLGNVAYYEVLNRGTKAATVVPLTALYPLVTILLAVLVLKERLNAIQFIGLVLSLGAIYLFNVQQEEGFLSSWLVVALIPIFLWGIAGLLQKLATNHVSGELSTLWFLGAFIPVALVILAQNSMPQLSWRTWRVVAALGFAFAIGNFALLAAFASNGKASVITPLASLYPVVSIPIAIVFLHERIGSREMAGVALALVSVVALSRESPGASEIQRSK